MQFEMILGSGLRSRWQECTQPRHWHKRIRLVVANGKPTGCLGNPLQHLKT